MTTFKSTWLQDSNTKSVSFGGSSPETITTDSSESLAISDAIKLKSQSKMRPDDFEAVLKVFQTLRRWRNETELPNDTQQAKLRTV